MVTFRQYRGFTIAHNTDCWSRTTLNEEHPTFTSAEAFEDDILEQIDSYLDSLPVQYLHTTYSPYMSRVYRFTNWQEAISFARLFETLNPFQFKTKTGWEFHVTL